MADKEPAALRFMVRQGNGGWMVYDRQQKRPALIGTDLAVNLTKEQASQPHPAEADRGVGSEA